MPRELIAVEPGQCALREYEEAPLGADEIRARSLYSAVKHGTEFSDLPGEHERCR